MSGSDQKADLHRYLQAAREALLWKLNGPSEYDIRRPMTPTGTNLLGLIKHVASVEAGYFGDTFGRAFDEPLPWIEDDAEPNADMWATADESRDEIVGLYQRVWAHSDATIDTLALDAIGHVPWWPEEHSAVTLHRILIHMIAETDRHAGHADIVRELIDGAAGLKEGNDNLAAGDQAWWENYRSQLERSAQEAGREATSHCPPNRPRSPRTPPKEHEFSAGPVGRAADLVHGKAAGDQRGLDLGSVAEAQRRVRRQHLTIGGEHHRRAETDQRQAEIGHLHPTLDRADALDLGTTVRRRAGPLLPCAVGRVTGFEDDVTAGSQRVTHAAQRCLPVGRVNDRLGDVRGHRCEVDLHRGQGCRIAEDPVHALGAGLGSGHAERAARGVDSGHLDTAIGE